MAKLILIAKGAPQEIQLGQELTIGRGYSNLLRLDGEEISRVHAIIYRRDDAFLLRDLDSKNGVFINGNSVTMGELHPGDEIRIGKHRMFFDPPGEIELDDQADSRESPYSPAPQQAEPGFALPEKPDFEQSQLFRGTPGRTPALVRDEPAGLDEVKLLTRIELLDLCRSSEDDPTSQALQLETQIMARLVNLAVSRQETEAGSLPDLLLRAMAEMLDASGAVIVLHDIASGSFAPAAIFPAQADVAVNRVVMREGFSQGRGVLCPSTADCGLFRDSTTVTRDRISTLISVPLAGPEGEAGLLYLDRKGEVEPFIGDHLVVAARVARVLELELFEAGSQITPSREALR